MLFLFSSLPIHAQVGEPRSGIAFGFSGGVTMNRVTFDPTIKQKSLLSPTMGVTLRLTSEKYFTMVCALQLELNYARLGWSEDIFNSNNEPLPDTYSRHLDYVQIPMLARLGWGRENRGLMFYVLAGPQIGYCISESSERSAEWTLGGEGVPDRPNHLYAQYDMSIDHKFDYGITGGLGLELNTKIGHFMMDGRYYYGLSDLFSNGKKDVFSRSNSGTIVAKLTYLFDIRK